MDLSQRGKNNNFKHLLDSIYDRDSHFVNVVFLYSFFMLNYYFLAYFFFILLNQVTRYSDDPDYTWIFHFLFRSLLTLHITITRAYRLHAHKILAHIYVKIRNEIKHMKRKLLNWETSKKNIKLVIAVWRSVLQFMNRFRHS